MLDWADVAPHLSNGVHLASIIAPPIVPCNTDHEPACNNVVFGATPLRPIVCTIDKCAAERNAIVEGTPITLLRLSVVERG